ncbi:MAG TPA: phospholipase D family protein [Candidatus Acidoferrales bacterium]|nr:phospholipase D family protein [Candidatus Acidoferrales bacterium]
MTRLLPDGQSIRKEVRRLFNKEKGRRVALVAFVGKNAEAYLPRPKGLELVCWPQAPGTNPTTVGFLLKKKVDVRFAKRLHMKVYWTKNHGAVVTSANLSTNAYGAGALHEAGVLLPSTSIDIDALLEAVSPQKVTKSALAKLKRAAAATIRRSLRPQEKRSFLDWLSMVKRPRWLLCCINLHTSSPSQRLRDVAKEETGSSTVFDWVNCRKGELNPEDFALTLILGSSRGPVVSGWLYVHRVVLPNRRDKRYNKDWPYEAGQLYRNSACPSQPFHIDGAFRRALRATYRELGKKADKVFSIEITRSPGTKLLERLRKHYVKDGR